MRRCQCAATAGCWEPQRSGVAGREGSAQVSRKQQATTRPVQSGSWTAAFGRTQEVAPDNFASRRAGHCACDRLLPGWLPFAAGPRRRGRNCGQRQHRRKLDADTAAIGSKLMGQQHVNAGGEFGRRRGTISERTRAIAGAVAVALPGILRSAGRLTCGPGAPLLIGESALLLDSRVDRIVIVKVLEKIVPSRLPAWRRRQRQRSDARRLALRRLRRPTHLAALRRRGVAGAVATVCLRRRRPSPSPLPPASLPPPLAVLPPPPPP